MAFSRVVMGWSQNDDVEAGMAGINDIDHGKARGNGWTRNEGGGTIRGVK
jgi:hypothetical protein